MKTTISFRLKIYLTIFAILMIIAIAGFMIFEQMSLTDAVYFSIVTMATVGYGDIHPQTDIGKILTMIIIVGGVGTFLGVVASITDLFVNRREESLRQQKIDMMAGLFFSEMGNDLLKEFSTLDPELHLLNQQLLIDEHWTLREFDQVKKDISARHLHIDARHSDFAALLKTLQNRSDLLLRLLENPYIQEHENFTDLLRALFHLRDELLHRPDLQNIIQSDRKHLEGDIARVYNLLVIEWLHYVRYLKNNYQFLFSLAMRSNPFDPAASIAVKEQ